MGKKNAIICDIDGTAAIIGNRSPFNATKAHIVDTPNWPVLTLLKVFKKEGYQIIFVTGREDKYKMQTLSFIEKYTGWTEKDFILYMRKTGDRRKDVYFKTEIYNSKIKPDFEVLFALEDRNQMVDGYRNGMNVPCFQVAEGNF